MNEKLLSASGARHFLEKYWQKKPLFKQGALPAIDTSIDRTRLIELACCEDVESRLVVGTGKIRDVRHGPFRQRDFARLPPRNWTLLVNGVENFVPAARALQTQFGFVPYARHDDVMVSYAAPGGGVGPHYDSYDVFLLQGAGRRRWQISAQKDLALVEGAPLRILRRFRPRQEWVLEYGDLLYLPPKFAHYGVAIDECVTWSIGMRAPDRQAMAARFLDFLHDRLQLQGEYRDPGLRPQRHPAAVGAAMLRQVRTMVSSITWTDADIARCLGEYLTEPKSNIVFARPRPMSPRQFLRAAVTHGIRLDLKSRMLLGARTVFINGESAAQGSSSSRVLRQLADRRSLRPGTPLKATHCDLLYQWYRAGYLEVGER